ncbi:MAG: NADH-quinone oxidoreductase subunit J [Verrucomicrobia bacterium]|nr:MAG: NADH-quinone oxidoreductase subunit J [Verrucomicrobiota bacterium]
MGSFLFDFFAIFTVICAVGTVVNKNAVNAAMCFLLCLVGVAGLFVQLDAYLLAFLLLLVYAGAVVALFLFIIMLLDVQGKSAVSFRRLSTAAAVIAAGLLAVGLCSFAIHGHLDAPNPNYASGVGAALKPYAYQLFTLYLLPVQIMGFLLLIAMLGVIVLSKKIDPAEGAK